MPYRDPWACPYRDLSREAWRSGREEHGIGEKIRIVVTNGKNSRRGGVDFHRPLSMISPDDLIEWQLMFLRRDWLRCFEQQHCDGRQLAVPLESCKDPRRRHPLLGICMKEMNDSVNEKRIECTASSLVPSSFLRPSFLSPPILHLLALIFLFSSLNVQNEHAAVCSRRNMVGIRCNAMNGLIALGWRKNKCKFTSLIQEEIAIACSHGYARQSGFRILCLKPAQTQIPIRDWNQVKLVEQERRKEEETGYFLREWKGGGQKGTKRNVLSIIRHGTVPRPLDLLECLGRFVFVIGDAPEKLARAASRNAESKGI